MAWKAGGATLSISNRKYLAGLAVLALLVTACGDGGGAVTTGAGTGTTGADTGTTAADTATTAATGTTGGAAAGNVVFWTSATNPVDIAAMENIVAAFNELGGPTAELVQVTGAETEATQLITAVRGGTGPDVYMLDRFTVAQRAADGLLEDLTQFDPDPLAGYIDFAAEEATFDGKAYALPFDTDTRALYYNIDILEEVGIDPAELDPANGPITWDRVMEIANQITTEEGDNYTRMGFVPWQTWSNGQGWHYTFGFSWEADFYDEAGCQVTPDTPENMAAFQWLYDTAAALDVAKTSAFVAADQPNDLPPEQQFFYQGKVGMLISGDWLIAGLAQYAPDMNYGITYIPVPEEGVESSTWAGGWSMVIPEGAQNPEGAWEFLNYIAGEEGQRVYSVESAHLPTWAALSEEEGLLDERHAFFGSLLPQAENRPPLPVGALYWDELTTAFQATYLNQTQPAEALASVKERTQAQLDQFC
jgi:multiple sugar transport system substrate-binding protein